eukprot:208347_1
MNNEKPYIYLSNLTCKPLPNTLNNNSPLTLPPIPKFQIETEKEEKKHNCNECGKSYKQTSSLQRHIKKTHSGIDTKQHQCTYCNSSFHSKYQLTVHNRTHTNERPYSCKRCPKKFRQNSHLLTHIRTHTKEKPYQCKECGKRFTQSSSVTTHMRIHKNIKPFSCPHCLQQFTQKHSRDRHVSSKKGACKFKKNKNKKLAKLFSNKNPNELKLNKFKDFIIPPLPNFTKEIKPNFNIKREEIQLSNSPDSIITQKLSEHDINNSVILPPVIDINTSLNLPPVIGYNKFNNDNNKYNNNYVDSLLRYESECINSNA